MKVFVWARAITDASRKLEGKLRQRGWHPGDVYAGLAGTQTGELPHH